jgi:hypothetical protein
MKIILVILLLGMTISCQKDIDSETETEVPQNPVYAGVINENMNFIDFANDFSLSYTWNCGYGDAADSIDLFEDGVFDVFLSARFLNEALFWTNECCPPPGECFPSGLKFDVEMQNDYEIAIYETTMREGYPGYLASHFSSNTRIDTISNWAKSTHFWTDMFGLIGPWHNIESDKYMAIRKQIDEEYEYGWIRIGPAPYGNLIFKEYSVE